MFSVIIVMFEGKYKNILIFETEEKAKHMLYRLQCGELELGIASHMLTTTQQQKYFVQFEGTIPFPSEQLVKDYWEDVHHLLQYDFILQTNIPLSH